MSKRRRQVTRTGEFLEAQPAQRCSLLHVFSIDASSSGVFPKQRLKLAVLAGRERTLQLAHRECVHFTEQFVAGSFHLMRLLGELALDARVKRNSNAFQCFVNGGRRSFQPHRDVFNLLASRVTVLQQLAAMIG